MTFVRDPQFLGQQKNTAITNSNKPFRKDNNNSPAIANGAANPHGKAVFGNFTIANKTTVNTPHDPRLLSDDRLFSLCQQYGNNAKMWKRKFEELLPEVMKRDLYKKKRFISIYEFAAKVGGLSYDAVDEVLRVYKQLEDKPKLKALVVEFGWSKLRIVSGIATVDTDESWAEKVRVLPKSSLETIVRDFRRQEGLKNGGQSAIKALIPKNDSARTGCGGVAFVNKHTGEISTYGSSISDKQMLLDHKKIDCVRLPGEETEPEDFNGRPIFGNMENGWPIMSFKVDPETEFRLRKLKLEVEKERKTRLSFNQFFRIMIERAEGNCETKSRQRVSAEKIDKAYEKESSSTIKKNLVTNNSKNTEIAHREDEFSANKSQIIAQKGRLADLKIHDTRVRNSAENMVHDTRVNNSPEKKIQNTRDWAISGGKIKSCACDKAAVEQTKPASRHIPTAIKKFIIQKYHGRCGFPGCKKPFEVFHHVQRFALWKAHNPDTIVPLCKEHHNVAHGGWIGNEREVFWEDEAFGDSGFFGENSKSFGGGVNGGGGVDGGGGVNGGGGVDGGGDVNVSGGGGNVTNDWEVSHDIKLYLPSRELDEIVRGCRENFVKKFGGRV